MATITPVTFKNWPNDWQIAWSKNSDVFGHENQIIFFFLPWIILLFVYLFRKKFLESMKTSRSIHITLWGLLPSFESYDLILLQ